MPFYFLFRVRCILLSKVFFADSFIAPLNRYVSSLKEYFSSSSNFFRSITFFFFIVPHSRSFLLSVGYNQHCCPSECYTLYVVDGLVQFDNEDDCLFKKFCFAITAKDVECIFQKFCFAITAV